MRGAVAATTVCALGVVVAGSGVGSGSSSTSVRQAAQARSPSCRTPPLHLGLDAYGSLADLPLLEFGDTLTTQTTADPAALNHDSGGVIRRRADGGRVLLDATGPGILTFVRFQEATGSPWELGVDDAPALRFGPRDLGQLSPRADPAALWPYPLSLTPEQSQGSSIIARPIPFRRHITLTALHTNGNFYALLRRLPVGTPLDDWRSQDPSTAISLLRGAGTEITAGAGRDRSGTLNLDAGVESPLVALADGPREIRSLVISVGRSDAPTAGRARLRIYWDGERRPSVDAPLAALAGDAGGVDPSRGRPVVAGLLGFITPADGSRMDVGLEWPMPYHRSARITLTAPAGLHDVVWRLRSQAQSQPSAWWGTFHATASSVPAPTPGRDMTFLDVDGSGRVVGTVVNFGSIGSTLEGDPRFYIDGSTTPQVQATGTEEWGLGGDYWRGGHLVTLPLGGLATSTTDTPPGLDGAGSALYRYLVADSVPFLRHLTLHWEHGGVDEATGPYTAVVLWYGVATPGARVTDTLDLADAPARSRHAYSSSSSETTTALTAAVEYGVDAPPQRVEIAGDSAPLSFSMALDPANQGAVLRRSFDHGVPDQLADVLVDGQLVGAWWSPGVATTSDARGVARRLRQEDLPIPASLTSHRTRVTVTIRPRSPVVTASDYTMLSIVPPGCAPTG